MRALWITTSLCLASTAVLAQPASPNHRGLGHLLQAGTCSGSELLEFRRQCGAASGVHSERTQGAARMP